MIYMGMGTAMGTTSATSTTPEAMGSLSSSKFGMGAATTESGAMRGSIDHEDPSQTGLVVTSAGASRVNFNAWPLPQAIDSHAPQEPPSGYTPRSTTPYPGRGAQPRAFRAHWQSFTPQL